MSYPVSLRFAGLAVAAILAASAQAQVDPAKSYPSKPVRVIVGYAAGGSTDIMTRLVCQKLSESLGQPVVVENKTGASAIIGTEFVAKAQPDGYTLLMSPYGVFVINPIMFAKLPYSSVRDFAPVSTIATYALILAVNPSKPIQSVKELVDYVKANPQSANTAGAGAAFQLATELFKIRTGTRIEYIPYKGTNESVSAVVAGDVLMTLSDVGGVSGGLKSGKVRGLAVTASKRLPSYPDIPTMAEAGVPDLEVEGWVGLLAPAGTPVAIVRKLQDEINRIVKLPDVAERLNALSVRPMANTSEQFAHMIASELARWSAVAKTSNIKPAN